MLIAEVDGERAGVLLSSSPGAYPQGRPGRAEQVAATGSAGKPSLLYRPAVVD